MRVSDTSNLSLGGTSEDVTDRVHPRWRELCRSLAADMDLVLCGVDLACADITAAEGDYAIIEINAAPGMDNYAASGAAQTSRVRQLYREIFNGLGGGRGGPAAALGRLGVAQLEADAADGEAAAAPTHRGVDGHVEGHDPLRPHAGLDEADHPPVQPHLR